MTSGLSNVSRIHFGFDFFVNPDPDPIIEFSLFVRIFLDYWNYVDRP